jgi:hypothetical protein
MTRDTAICASGMSACPVSGSLKAVECLDLTTDAESCGGCASVGKGEDCTLIDGSKDVACVAGTCQVKSCDFGFELNVNGTGCDLVLDRTNREKLVMGSLKGVEKFWGY